MSDRTPSVLFVCMGNICRSPAGEGLFLDLLAQRGLDDAVEVDSAGTIGYHTGAAPDRRMRRAAEARGVTLEGAARQVRADDFERFDLVIAMDRENHADLDALGLTRGGQLRLLSDFLDADQRTTWGVDVPDPYYGGDAGFEHVLDMIEAARERLLEHLIDPAADEPRR
ncbi:MAG: low molecular weight protein-tyrosine-phosphatase [Acidobacteriota bacterium]